MSNYSTANHGWWIVLGIHGWPTYSTTRQTYVFQTRFASRCLGMLGAYNSSWQLSRHGKAYVDSQTPEEAAGLGKMFPVTLRSSNTTVRWVAIHNPAVSSDGTLWQSRDGKSPSPIVIRSTQVVGCPAIFSWFQAMRGAEEPWWRAQQPSRGAEP